MPRAPKLTLVFAPEAVDHLDAIERKYHLFYEVDTAEQTVLVLAVGVKAGSRLFIGGEEFQP